MGQNSFALNKWIAEYNSKSHSWQHHTFYHKFANKKLDSTQLEQLEQKKARISDIRGGGGMYIAW